MSTSGTIPPSEATPPSRRRTPSLPVLLQGYRHPLPAHMRVVAPAILAGLQREY
jgi:hypothetical protein